MNWTLHSVYRLKPRGPGGRVWMGPWEMVVWRWGCGVRDWMGKCPFRRSRQRVYSLRHVKNCNMVPVHSSCPTISSTASAPQYCESSLYCSHVPGQYHVTSWAAKHGGSWLALHHPLLHFAICQEYCHWSPVTIGLWLPCPGKLGEHPSQQTGNFRISLLKEKLGW